jgi:hypothetical protein
MVLHADDIAEEYEVESIYDFMSKVGFKEELKKIYGSTEDIVEAENYDSDETAIAEVLDNDNRLWTMTWIEDRRCDGYWIIRRLNKLAEITIPIAECDVEDMRDESWAVDWCFDFVDVHLTREEEEDDVE